MKNLCRLITNQPTDEHLHLALSFMRIGIGILTIGHGLPKIMGATQTWQFLGAAMASIGITFWPVMWGFLAAMTEFVGGILFSLGLGTRIASFFLAIMMFVATLWHISKGDPFTKYSFPLTVMIIFLAFIVIGGSKYSLDYYLSKK
jgi:putative oxidoreductase